MTDTRYIVAVDANWEQETRQNQTASQAAEFLIKRYASPEYDPEQVLLYLYIDDGSITLYDDIDYSFEKYSDKELDIEYHIASYTSTQLVFKFPGEEELVDQPTAYEGLQAQIERRDYALQKQPDLEYARIRYRLEPEWKTVS